MNRLAKMVQLVRRPHRALVINLQLVPLMQIHSISDVQQHHINVRRESPLFYEELICRTSSRVPTSGQS